LVAAQDRNSKSSPGGGGPFDRPAPANIDAEKAVLGCILLKADVCDDVASFIRSDDFFEPAHLRIFTHMLALHEQGRRPDITLLVDRLKAAGQYDAVGGAAYLAELFQAVPTAANAMHYAGIVR
jgi:replicative DNA helicase